MASLAKIRRLAAQVLVACFLAGCVTPPASEQNSQIDGIGADDEVGAAVASASVWRWIGRGLFRLITNTTFNVDVEIKSQAGE